MNIGRVYTPPISKVHTPPIFIASAIDPSTGGIGARDEYWKGVHPCNIHRKGYGPVGGGYRGTR